MLESKASSRLEEDKVHLRTGFELESVFTETSFHWRGVEVSVGTAMVVVVTVEVLRVVIVGDSGAAKGGSRVTVGGSGGTIGATLSKEDPETSGKDSKDPETVVDSRVSSSPPHAAVVVEQVPILQTTDSRRFPVQLPP